MRSMLVALGTVGIAVSGVVVAPVANAANALTCPNGSETEALTGDSQSWTLPSGTPCDRAELTLGSGISRGDVLFKIAGTTINVATGELPIPAAGSVVTLDYSGTASGTITMTFWDWDGRTNMTEKSIYTVTVGPVASVSSPSSGSSEAASGPAPLLQQFGMPATGTCDEAQPEGLDWAGVASGGWSTAWGEWMHDGLGGWACSRTLSYSSSQGMWVVD